MAQQEVLDEIKSKIQEHLVSSGNYDIINKQLKLLLYESGWIDQVRQLAVSAIQESLNKGQQLNFENLYAHVKPKAEEIVPEEVRKDTLERLRVYLEDIIQ